MPALPDRLAAALRAAEALVDEIAAQATRAVDRRALLDAVLDAVVAAAPADWEPQGAHRRARRRALEALVRSLLAQPKPRGRPRQPAPAALAQLCGTGRLGPFVVGVDDQGDTPERAASVVPAGRSTPAEAAALAALKETLRGPGQPLPPDHPLYDRAFDVLARRLKDDEPLSAEERVRWARIAAVRAASLTGPPHREREAQRNALILALAREARRYAGRPLDRPCAGVVRALFGERAARVATYAEQRRRLERAW